MGSLVHGCEFSPGHHRTESAPTACSSERQPLLRSKMNKNRRLCPCGSGKAMRQCCGATSSPSKLKLERSARILAETGMHADAARALAERAKLSPHNPMIWNDLGVEYLAAGQPDDAYKAFLRAHKVFPDYPIPLYNLGRLVLGRCLKEQERQAASADLARSLAMEAIGYLNECLLRDPRLSEAHALLSTAYGAIGDEVQARRHMQEASRLSPESPAAPKLTWLQRIPMLSKVGGHPTRPQQPFISSTGKHANLSAY